MWQRIQTVFLSIVILSLVAAIFLPIWVYQDATGKAHALYALHYSTMENGVTTTLYFPYAITAILMAASATLSFIEIRSFKNRIAQIKMGALNALLIAGAMCSAVYFATEMIKTYKGGSYGFGLWMPALAVVCNWLAIRFIKKDEKLVRDSSRLR